MAKIKYTAPGPVAAAFMQSNARRRFITGPFGSGKSTACCMEIFRRAREQAPAPDKVRRTRWAVIRNTYPDLKNTTVKTWQAWFSEEFGVFNHTPPYEHKISFPLRDGTRVEAEVIFLAMDDEKDQKKFLSLEVTGIWFNEVRELPKALIEAGDGRIGRYPRMVDGGPTWYGIIADTNMPDEDHWIHAIDHDPNSGFSFFHQPGGVMKVDGQWVTNPAAENIPNLPPGYYTNQLVGKSPEWVAVYLGAEYGSIPTEGAYYADLFSKADAEGRVGMFPHNPGLRVHTFWDLGRGDDTAIWFGQQTKGGWVWIDYYENHNKGLDHYAAHLDNLKTSRGFKYGSHIWPHDGNNSDIALPTDKNRAGVMADLGYPVTVLPRTRVSDGIEETRKLIAVSCYDREHCKEGVNKLRRYKREFNEVRQVFMKTALHDYTSHCADAHRTAAMGQDLVEDGTNRETIPTLTANDYAWVA